MTALRRDLIERKMWIVVALLIVGVVAVPVLLLNGGSADGAAAAPPPPPAATAAPIGPSASVTAKASPANAGSRKASSHATKVAWAHLSRDPFAPAATSATTTTPATSAPVASASTTTSTTSGSTNPTNAVTVTPSPIGAGTPSSAAATTTAAPTSTTATPSTSHATASPPVSTTASVTPVPATAVQSWTVYSVDVRYGKDISVRLRSNLPRLTPLPAADNPEAMFLGVMSGGQQAVFALRAGVGHAGPGLCRPDHVRCSAIVLKAGQTEQLTVPVTGGAAKRVVLRVVRITRTVTHSRKAALAAYERYSTAGLCDLALADPVLYNLGSGTVSGVPKAVCERQPASVPFTPLLATP